MDIESVVCPRCGEVRGDGGGKLCDGCAFVRMVSGRVIHRVRDEASLCGCYPYLKLGEWPFSDLWSLHDMGVTCPVCLDAIRNEPS